MLTVNLFVDALPQAGDDYLLDNHSVEKRDNDEIKRHRENELKRKMSRVGEKVHEVSPEISRVGMTGVLGVAWFYMLSVVVAGVIMFMFVVVVFVCHEIKNNR